MGTTRWFPRLQLVVVKDQAQQPDQVTTTRLWRGAANVPIQSIQNTCWSCILLDRLSGSPCRVHRSLPVLTSLTTKGLQVLSSAVNVPPPRTNVHDFSIQMLQRGLAFLFASSCALLRLKNKSNETRAGTSGVGPLFSAQKRDLG